MNTSGLLRSAAALFAMGVSSACVVQASLVTLDTTAGFTGMDSYNGGAPLMTGSSVTQTFSNVGSFDALVFRFVTNQDRFDATFGATDLTFFLTEWSGNDSTATQLSTGAFSIAASGSWSASGDGSYFYDSVVDLSGAGPLNVSATYGLSIFADSVSNGNFRLARDTSGSGAGSYADGSAFFHVGSGFSSLQSGGMVAFPSNSGADFVFYELAGSSPVPEASTAAVLFAGVFVGGMMTRRRPRQAVALDAAQA